MKISASVFGYAATLVLGALVGLLATFVAQRQQQRAARKDWLNNTLYTVCAEFTATVRRFAHLVQRLDRAADPAEQEARIDEVHGRLRALTEELRLIGDVAVQRSAQMVQRHAYALRVVAEGGEDLRLDEFGGVTADTRLFAALEDFYRAARARLGIPNADDVLEVPR